MFLIWVCSLSLLILFFYSDYVAYAQERFDWANKNLNAPLYVVDMTLTQEAAFKCFMIYTQNESEY
jgi:hypothetical protein